MKVEEFISEFSGWKSPQAWSDWFGVVPKTSGVYVFIYTTDGVLQDINVLYIGSAKNLKRRFSGHKMWVTLQKDYPFFMFYWKEESDYLNVEKQLIKKYQPKYNKNCK